MGDARDDSDRARHPCVIHSRADRSHQGQTWPRPLGQVCPQLWKQTRRSGFPQSWKRRRRVERSEHPETKQGVAGGKARQRSATADSAVADTFATDTGAKTGQSARTVRQDVQVAESIPEDVREQLRESAIADAKTDRAECRRYDTISEALSESAVRPAPLRAVERLFRRRNVRREPPALGRFAT